MEQRQLFEDPTVRPAETPLHRKRETCTPNPVGSGPDGETCKSCRHCRERVWAKRYYKCGLMVAYWTRGSGSDIKVGWPACKSWEPREGYDQELIDEFNRRIKESPQPIESLDQTTLYVIADWFREQGREGAFLALAQRAKQITP